MGNSMKSEFGTVALETRVQDAIRQNPYLAQRNLRCEAQEGRVVLRGRVKTFFQKQMAQEVVRNIDGITLVENFLEVD
jgi:osmotically-inducible protein OsmY